MVSVDVVREIKPRATASLHTVEWWRSQSITKMNLRELRQYTPASPTISFVLQGRREHVVRQKRSPGRQTSSRTLREKTLLECSKTLKISASSES